MRKKIFVCLLISFMVFAPVPAKSLTGEGFGATLNDAKADALNDLLTKIRVNINSNTETRTLDYNEGSHQTYSQNTLLTTDYTLMYVRYDVSPSSTKTEKASGKYKCIAEISDADKDQCILRASELVLEIETLNGLLSNESDLRAQKACYEILETRLSEYESCYLTAKLLGYSNEMPKYDHSISREKNLLEIKRIQEELLKAGLAGKIDDTTTDYFENLLLSNLWNKTKNKPTSLQSSAVSDGTYSKTYKVGDFGPGGGIVFYDKGQFSDGWRYLEVASEDIFGSYPYGKSGKINTSLSLGAGKQNSTQIIELNGSNSSFAALACANYNGGGYDDWYLPSKDELELIYKKLGNNKNLSMKKDGYWSSSQLNSSYAYGFSLKTKKSFTDSGSAKHRVRAVRSF